MHDLLRQRIVVASVLLIAGAAAWWHLSKRDSAAIIEAGFWFEPVAYGELSLGRPMTADEMARIESTARAELARAFDGLRIRVSNRRDVKYHVRVTDHVRDPRFERDVSVAGRSRAMAGLGGQGEVSFAFLANSAIVYAPRDADREAIIDAIGRGIGRAAVHEFTHQLLPAAPIHASRDVGSYEYRSAARAEQYYGELHWDLAWPWLVERLGP